MAARKPAIKRTKKQRGVAEGYRSGLEEIVAEQLQDAGVKAQYEPFKISYEVPASVHRYTPDYVLPNGIIIETKGRFVTADRKKHKLIKEQYPDLDIRFVFSNSRGKISKASKTTYAMWCEKYGYKFADRLIPEEWLVEKIPVKSKTLIGRFTQ